MVTHRNLRQSNKQQKQLAYHLQHWRSAASIQERKRRMEYSASISTLLCSARFVIKRTEAKVVLLSVILSTDSKRKDLRNAYPLVSTLELWIRQRLMYVIQAVSFRYISKRSIQQARHSIQRSRAPVRLKISLSWRSGSKQPEMEAIAPERLRC